MSRCRSIPKFRATPGSAARRGTAGSRAALRDISLWYWVLVECLAQDRPVHGLITENAGDVLGEIAVGEPWHGTEVGGRRAVFEIGSEAKHISLGLQCLHRKLIGRSLLRLDRSATELLDRLDEEIGMILVLALELHCDVEYWL